MKITSDALASLRGRGAEPDLRDTEILVHNQGFVAVPVRSPLHVLDAAPTDVNGVEFSFLYSFDILTAVVTPLTSTNLGYLAPGLWTLTVGMGEILDFALTPATAGNIGIRLFQPSAVLAQTIFQVGPERGWSLSPSTMTIEIDQATQVVAVTRAIGAAQSGRWQGFVLANRHF